MGKASFTMGLFGITEGAIPFAAQDPLRIIPSNMIGAMVAAVIAAMGGVGDRVAHGGPIVAVLGGIDHIIWFFIAVIIGSLVTMITILILKRNTPVTDVEENQVDAHLETSTNSSQESKHSESKVDESVEHNDNVFQKDVININTNVKTKEEAIDYMVKNLKEHRFINNEDVVKQAILNREAESTTAIGMNVAIPHAKSDAVKQPTVAVLQNKEGVDWISLDETLPKILFMIVVPNDSNNTHLKLLQRLSRSLMDDKTREALINAPSKDDIYDILKEI